MKTKPTSLLRTALVVLGLTVSTLAADTAATLPTFSAILTMGKDQRFGLATTTGQTRFVTLGEEFDGYKLQSYEAKAETLVLERDGKLYRVLINAPIIGASKPVGTKATLADAETVMNQIKFEDMILKSLEAQKKAMTQMTRQMAGPAMRNVDKAEFEAHQTKIFDALIEAMDLPKLKQATTQMYAELFTKEELKAMSDFHSTPAGLAMIEKQPEIQQRLQTTMMPRIMAAMPKVQEISKQFAQEQKAKAQAAKAAAEANLPTATVDVTPTPPAPKPSK